MPRTLDQQTARELLQRRGWRVVPRAANHGIKMEKPGKRPVILPRYRGRPYLRGVHHDIVKQAGLDPKEVRVWISRSKCVPRERDTGRVL